MTPIIKGIVASGISGHLTPAFSYTGDYYALGSVTVPSGGLTSVKFSGIPQTGFDHLELRISAADNYADPSGDMMMVFNDDTGSNYASMALTGNRANAYAGAETYANLHRIVRVGAANAPGYFGGGIVSILDYNSTKNKSIRAFTGIDVNTEGYVSYRSQFWNSSSSINSITLTSRYGTTISEFSKLSLYGVK
jgi:hypothetical protein